jgi:hypothetical protein
MTGIEGLMGLGLKVHVPPCVVLVINDNPYGLIFALSYICRTFRRQRLSHLLGSRL